MLVVMATMVTVTAKKVTMVMVAMLMAMVTMVMVMVTMVMGTMVMVMLTMMMMMVMVTVLMVTLGMVTMAMVAGDGDGDYGDGDCVGDDDYGDGDYSMVISVTTTLTMTMSMAMLMSKTMNASMSMIMAMTVPVPVSRQMTMTRQMATTMAVTIAVILVTEMLRPVVITLLPLHCRQVHLNRQLLRLFFAGVQRHLKSNGEVHVTIKTVPPYSRWDVPAQVIGYQTRMMVAKNNRHQPRRAQTSRLSLVDGPHDRCAHDAILALLTSGRAAVPQAEASGLHLARKAPFRFTDFPGYHHRTTEKDAMTFDAFEKRCVTFVFVAAPGKQGGKVSRQLLELNLLICSNCCFWCCFSDKQT